MKIYIVVGSVREGRTAIKVAHWVLQEIKSYAFSTLETEIVDLKEWDLLLSPRSIGRKTFSFH